MEKDSIENILLLLDGGVFDYLDIETKFDFIMWLYDHIQYIQCDFNIYKNLKRREDGKWEFANKITDKIPVKYQVTFTREISEKLKINGFFHTSDMMTNMDAYFGIYFNGELLTIKESVPKGGLYWQHKFLSKLNDFLWKFVF